MRFSKMAMTAALAVSMVAFPTMSQAAQTRAAVSKLSVGVAPVARAGAPVRNAAKDGGGSIIIAVLAAAAVVAGIVIAADNNKTPTSA